jgi:hypothetical protein
MTTKGVPPSIKETAFSCPHCGAYTTQEWFAVHAKHIERDTRLPFTPDEDTRKDIAADSNLDQEMRKRMLAWLDKLSLGEVLIEKRQDSLWGAYDASNLFLSQCYNCNKIAVWVYERLLFPPARGGQPANLDLPDHIRRDYEEAQSIVNLSPRGAAALLRLGIQKLCIHLGEKGKNIDDDIASLVAKGLNPVVQKSLDVVRVIGNEAVHPGVLDLKDDQDTANTLFTLVNLIVDQMITHPKTVDEMFAKLPESKKAAIAARDEKANREK